MSGPARARTPLPADYWRLWSSSVASNLGDGMRLTAIPLLAAAIDPTPLTVSVVSAVSYLPWLLLALVAGAVADRVDRRRLMVRLQIVRAVAVAAFAVMLTAGHASMVPLVALALVLGVAEVFFDCAAATAVPAVLPPHQLERGNSRLLSAEMVANEFAGPPVGSVLFAWRQAVPFWLDALTFAVSALLLGRLRTSLNPHDAPAETGPKPGLLASIREGLALTWASAFLRTWTLMLAVLNFARAMTVAVFVLYVLQLLGGNELTFGVLSAMVAVGAAAGGWHAKRVVDRIGRKASLALGLALHAGSNLLLATVVGVVPTALAGIAFGVGVAVSNVVFVSIRQVTVPASHLGRVSSVQRFFAWGALPLGALAGGAFAASASLRAPYAIAAILVLVAGALLWRPLMRPPEAAERLLDAEP
ncbi:MFS transporter [Nonomuraea sp. PA05]|uniref:MFS transporter n=1 Tax=Nonomuraea sp. PA05 TaxID=2604466 RepID=UPI0011D4E183|nr:MFS transporter [Nonomuraea sp. PA05]TYB55402.1 MFS transporter [Nonomuraea sp. PA05]